MGKTRIRYIRMLAILTVIWIGIPPGWAEEKYPNQAITSIVPFPADGASDAAARVFAEVIEKYLGQKVVVVNKPGSSGAVAGSALVKGKPDGYTIGHLAPMSSLPEVFTRNIQADYTSDQLVPVAQWSGYPQILFCRADSPFKTMKELFDYIPKRAKLLIGTQGIGLLPELAVRMAERQAGLDKFKYIAFTNDDPIILAVQGGHVDVGIVTFSSVLRQITLGTMRVLAIITENKLPYMDQIPNFYELGFNTGFRQFYLGVFVPKSTPEGAIKILEMAIEQTAKDETFNSMMSKMNMPVIYKNSEQLSSLMQEIKRTNIELGKKGRTK